MLPKQNRKKIFVPILMAGGTVYCISRIKQYSGDCGRKPRRPAAMTTTMPERGRMTYRTQMMATITRGFTVDLRSPA